MAIVAQVTTATYSTHRCGYCLKPHSKVQATINDRDEDEIECPIVHEKINPNGVTLNFKRVYWLVNNTGRWHKD